MIADWNDSHEQQVELEYVPNNDYMDGTRAADGVRLGRGAGPLHHQPGRLPALLQRRGAARPDAVHREGGAWPTSRRRVIANRMVDGKIYGVPMEVEPMAMYYSVAAFEEAGLNENDVPQTWDQLLEVAEQAHHRQALRGAVRRRARATTRTSPGIRSCGRAAATCRAPTARARSTRPA